MTKPLYNYMRMHNYMRKLDRNEAWDRVYFWLNEEYDNPHSMGVLRILVKLLREDEQLEVSK